MESKLQMQMQMQMQTFMKTLPELRWTPISDAEGTARGFCTVWSSKDNSTGGSRNLGRQRLEWWELE